MISADGQGELYDLVADPGELRNLMGIVPDETQRLASHVRQWLEAVPRYRPPASKEALGTDPEILEALRSLGYVD